MENKSDQVVKTKWGYELTWAEQESHGGKIIVFEKPSKTDFIFHKEKEKSYFVNSGSFLFKWIDTSNGNIFQQQGSEGYVFTVNKMVPSSIECLTQNGSLTETNNGVKDDTYIVIKTENVV